MMNRNKRQPIPAGFTLVELLVVVSIIALLIGILMPTFGKARASARRAADKATIAALDSACESFAADNKATYPASAVWTFDGSGVVDHHFSRSCSDGTTLNFGASTGLAYPGACQLYDQLVRNMDSSGVPLSGKDRGDAYGVRGLKTVQMKHPTNPGVLVDAYYFVDSSGRPILYYSLCLDPKVDKTITVPRYWDEHNPGPKEPPSSPLDAALAAANKVDPPKAIDLPRQGPLVGAPYSMHWRKFEAQPPNPTPLPRYEYYRGATKSNNGNNFILISPGLDLKYTPASADPATKGSSGGSFWFDPNTDDVTNFSVR